MHITEYFVILYSESQEIMNKFKVAYLHHQSMLNLEDDAAKEAGKEAGKEAEEEINLKEIYRKLLFIFHPDKSISPNEQIFGEIKKAWDDRYVPTIIYYFIKNSNHPMLKMIHDRLHNTKGFLIFLKNLCNSITREINDIQQTPIWKKYYNF